MLRILRRKEVVEITGIGASRLHELELRGEFPARRQLSARAVGWLSTEVEAWIKSREAVVAYDNPAHLAQLARAQARRRENARNGGTSARSHSREGEGCAAPGRVRRW